MTLQEIAQQMCRMKECEEFPLKWKAEMERMIHALNFAEDYYKYFTDLSIDISELVPPGNNIVHITQSGFVCMNIKTLRDLISTEGGDRQKFKEAFDKAQKNLNELNIR